MDRQTFEALKSQGGIEAILKESTEMLARITNYLSMIVAPTIDQSKFKHLELLKFDRGNSYPGSFGS